MPGIDAIRARPLLPPEGAPPRRTSQANPVSDADLARQGDAVDVSLPAREVATHIEGSRQVDVAAD